jgi:hypothetical protein
VPENTALAVTTQIKATDALDSNSCGTTSAETVSATIVNSPKSTAALSKPLTTRLPNTVRRIDRMRRLTGLRANSQSQVHGSRIGREETGECGQRIAPACTTRHLSGFLLRLGKLNRFRLRQN